MYRRTSSFSAVVEQSKGVATLPSSTDNRDSEAKGVYDLLKNDTYDKLRGVFTCMRDAERITMLRPMQYNNYEMFQRLVEHGKCGAVEFLIEFIEKYCGKEERQRMLHANNDEGFKNLLTTYDTLHGSGKKETLRVLFAADRAAFYKVFQAEEKELSAKTANECRGAFVEALQQQPFPQKNPSPRPADTSYGKRGSQENAQNVL